MNIIQKLKDKMFPQRLETERKPVKFKDLQVGEYFVSVDTNGEILEISIKISDKNYFILDSWMCGFFIGPSTMHIEYPIIKRLTKKTLEMLG